MSKKEEKLMTAEELAAEFKEHSVAEFFRKNKQMLGLYGKVRSLTTVVHEYCTNGIDACEEANILPDITIKVEELGNEYYEVTAKDNGPGLTKDTVGKALGQLLAGTKFHRMIQSRGQQGIGAAGATLFSQMTTGKPTKVITGGGKKAFSATISVDTKKNLPKVENIKDMAKPFRGTAIQAKFKGVLYRDNEQGVLEYLRRSAIANPHAKITLVSPKGEKTTFPRTAKQIPKPPKAMKNHPHGVSVDDLVTLAKTTKSRMTSSFLKTDFDRVGDNAIKEMAKKVSFDMKIDPHQLTWEEAEQVHKAFKEIKFMAPSTEGLRPIGEERIKKSLEAIVEPEFVHVITRKPKVYAGGFPFQVEIGMAYGGHAGRVVDEERRTEVMRFANRAPLLFDAGNCAITKAVNTIDWKRYGVRDLSNTPLSIFVNFISVHIPYTGAGKQAIADEEDVMEELRLALMKCGRKTNRYISAKLREEEKQMKRDLFYKYIPEIAAALAHTAKADKGVLEKKLSKLVLEKLKLEELEDAKQAEEENQVDEANAIEENNEEAG